MALAARTLTVDTLTTDQNGRVLTARYDSPPLNFMNAAFARDCRRLVSAAGKAPSVEGVVITGSPPDRFVTHFDVDELAGGLGRSRATLSRLHSMIRAMRSGVVYLAAINGPCLGGGLELALACGLRHVGDGEHIRLGSPEVLGGILPGAGDTQHRPRIVGNGRALELILEGRSLDPRAALELGRVHRMTPPVDLLAEAQATTARLATRSKVAVAVAKRAVYASSQLPICAGLLVEAVFTRERERLGDTPFLADPEPWAPGTR